MLDHAFVRAIAAVRDSLDDVLLQRRPQSESYKLDLTTGDTVWETAYVLPGEGATPHVLAYVTFEWTSWSQTTQAAIDAGDAGQAEDDDDVPDIGIEVTFRVQHLADAPDVAAIVGALPEDGPVGAPVALKRRPVSVHQHFDEHGAVTDYAVEVDFEGDYDLRADAKPRDDLGPLGGWVASTLVRLADLPFAYAPTPDPADAP